jgi:hypothetical protein
MRAVFVSVRRGGDETGSVMMIARVYQEKVNTEIEGVSA